MELQQRQLDQLADWLTDMDGRMAQWEPVGIDVDTIHAQVEAHKVRTQPCWAPEPHEAGLWVRNQIKHVA